MTFHINDHCTVSLQKLELPVFLGVTALERAQTQAIFIDVKFWLKPPLGCISDNIADTYCYAELVKRIKEAVTGKSFNLLEHIGFRIFKTLEKILGASTKIEVAIQKMPAIAGLMGGVTFTYSNYSL